jgi:hypothetical protein
MGEKVLYYLMPILKVLLFVFFIFLCLLPLHLTIEFNLIHFIKNYLTKELLVKGASVLAILGALLMIFKFYPKLTFRSVFVAKENALAGFLKGNLIGFVLIALCAGLMSLSNTVAFSAGKISIIIFLAYFIYFIFIALFEELIFRTFPLFVLAERYSALLGVLINSVLFGLIHFANPNFTWLAMLNISLAGALFATCTLLKRNISWAVGIHFSWNFAQGILLGYKVSGLNIPGLLLATPIGETYLSGGAFGIEGSIFCTLVLVILIVYLLFKYKIEPIKDSNFSEQIEKEIQTT